MKEVKKQMIQVIFESNKPKIPADMVRAVTLLLLQHRFGGGKFYENVGVKAPEYDYTMASTQSSCSLSVFEGYKYRI